MIHLSINVQIAVKRALLGRPTASPKLAPAGAECELAFNIIAENLRLAESEHLSDQTLEAIIYTANGICSAAFSGRTIDYMTSTQVTYVVETLLGDSVDKITPLLKGSLISLIKSTNLCTDIRKWRYKFDTSNEILIRYRVRLYSNSLSSVPASGKYDAFTDEDGTVSVFEYLCDSSNNFITDDFDFDKILYFSFDKRWKGYDPFKE